MEGGSQTIKRPKCSRSIESLFTFRAGPMWKRCQAYLPFGPLKRWRAAFP